MCSSDLNLEYNLGPVVMAALRDPLVIEIILNSDGRLWIERLGGRLEESGHMDAAQGWLVISLVASSLETVVTDIVLEQIFCGSALTGLDEGRYVRC